MSETLVERLRERAAQLDEAERPLSDATIAADEIERLRAVLTALADDPAVPPWIQTLARSTVSSSQDGSK